MHGLSPDEELDHWRSQARHWQRETERVRSLQDSHEARLVELFIAAHTGPVEIAADMSGEVARVVNAIRINARETERVKQALAHSEQALLLSDEDREALAFLRGDVMLELSHYDATEERTLALVQAREALDRLLSRGKDGR